ncbi:ATP-grasp domain-containing protein [Agaribacter flavus]|uniref:RimK family alpha-L-glutamate ligase n=1 Tax=Agaribacter flavus TaxID=1902781 RepID=A0ABV7FUH1_9ALTE
MKRCAFLSTDNLDDFFVYDDMLKPYLAEFGWEVRDVPWQNTAVDYNEFDLVIVRSTWDYQAHAESFLNCLERIDASSAILENPLSLMRWNLSKSYLQNLQHKGIPVLPSIWSEKINYSKFKSLYHRFHTDDLVIKPLVSANADFTYRVNIEKLERLWEELEGVFSIRPFLVQAYEESIETVGEYSLFYFEKNYSHAILKQPKAGDFRVQEEHGGQLIALDASDEMKKLAMRVLASLPELPLYARIDMLKTERGFEIIEVELIEPSLYFNMAEGSAERFATLIHKKYG